MLPAYKEEKAKSCESNGGQQTSFYLLGGKSTLGVASCPGVVMRVGSCPVVSGLHWMIHFKGESHRRKPVTSPPRCPGSHSSWAALLVSRSAKCCTSAGFAGCVGSLVPLPVPHPVPLPLIPLAPKSVPSALAAWAQVLCFCSFVHQYTMLCRRLCSKTRFLKLLVVFF